MNEILPVKIGELKNVFGHLAYRDGSRGSPFEERHENEFASIIDLLHVLDKLVIHYSRVSDKLQSDLTEEDSEALAEIFGEVAIFYMQKDLTDQHAGDLFVVFDTLEEVFYQYSTTV